MGRDRERVVIFDWLPLCKKTNYDEIGRYIKPRLAADWRPLYRLAIYTDRRNPRTRTSGTPARSRIVAVAGCTRMLVQWVRMCPLTPCVERPKAVIGGLGYPCSKTVLHDDVSSSFSEG